MRKKITAVLAAGVVLTMSSVSTAHEPPNFIGIIWQWPADQTPILDGNMVEWSIIPDDYSLTTDKLQALFEPGDQFVTYTEPDLSSLDIRVTPSYVNGGSRIYYGYERFDDAWTSDDDIEIVIDADHTGGGFHGTMPGRDPRQQAQSCGRGHYHLPLFCDVRGRVRPPLGAVLRAAHVRRCGVWALLVFVLQRCSQRRIVRHEARSHHARGASRC